MRKRFITARILIPYSAILIKVVVLKDLEIKTRFLMIRLAPDYAKGQSNFVPFRTVLRYLRGDHGRFIAVINLVGNAAPFVPVGFLVSWVFRKMTWQASLAIAVAVGPAMEGMQVVFRVGIFDVDDIILNAFGVIIGYWLLTIFGSAKGDTPASTMTTTQ
jgi:glycopeptide antibiotics resistance protein